LKKDVGDGRASSFLSMLQRIPELKHPPTYLLVENVVGFEVSFFAASTPRAVF
jgi:tRNA (cytosine38-C5)-methyltransferase